MQKRLPQTKLWTPVLVAAFLLILAAAGLVALEHHVDRLAEDHANNPSHYAFVIAADPDEVDLGLVIFRIR